MKAFALTVSVPLAVLPPTVVFPESLKHKISYDAIAQELRYIGVMTEAERDGLLDLSDDLDLSGDLALAYRTAIHDLFAASNAPLTPGDENAFLFATDAAQLFNERGDELPREVPDRFKYVLEKVVPHLRITLSRSLVKQMLSDALNLETAIVSQLLTQWVNAATDASLKAIADFLDKTFVDSQSKLTAGEFPEQFLTFKRLHKIATVITKLKVSADELAWIFQHGSDLGWLNLAELPVQPGEPDAPFPAWSKLVDGLQVRARLRADETTLFDLFDLIRSFEVIDGHAKAQFLEALSTLTGWSLADLEVLVGQKDDLSDAGLLKLIFPDHFQTEKALLVLIPCFKFIKRLGVSAQEVSPWIQPELSFEEARSIKQAVKAKYDNTQWLAVAKPLRDILREKQRASLVAYLVHHAALWLSDDEIAALQAAGQRPDANKLYAHFLLDVEMSPCMMTSRIKQASGSVQLFVQRCLMGLEENVAIDEEAAQQWKWMKNYRVWEANRKIFLYPENWIEPELRDDKTPFFKDLESELLQNEVNQDTVESAFLKYLEKLDAVARLKICGMYHQWEPGRNILHVFGRTDNIPPIYYYRRGVDWSYWTAWEEVNVDIEGDHLIPVVHQGRLKLFWPIFTEKQEEQYDSDLPPGDKYWEIQIAWSEYKNGKWTAKKISSDAEKLISNKFAPEDFETYASKDNYIFKALQWGHNLAILCLRISNLTETHEFEQIFVGVFAFTGCRGSILTQGMLDLIGPEAKSAGRFIKQIPEPLINRNTIPIYDYIARKHNELSPDRSQIQNMAFLEEALDFEVLSSKEEIDWDAIDDSLNLTSDYYLGTKVPTLNKTPGTFELLYQHHWHWYQLQLLNWVSKNRDKVNFLYFLLCFPNFQFLRIPSCFFYQDDFRTFFVIPVTWPQKVKVFDADEVSPEDLIRYTRNYGEEAVPISSDDTDFDFSTVGRLASETSHWDWGNRHISSYLFKVFYHPYLCRFIQVLNQQGVDGLLRRDIQLLSQDFFETEYEPFYAVVKGRKIEIEKEGESEEIYSLYPRDEVDFDFDGAYSQYNWELFFHAPLLIAERLSNNQRFAEAQQWFHYIFDPTDTSDEAVPKRYWRTRHFYETTDEQYQNEQIRTLLRTLADESADPGIRARWENQVRQWRRNPFKPHLIARLRTTAYQKATVMKYVDNLIAWGDYLFRQDTIESINEATQLYILAAEILGPHPQKIPARNTLPTKTVNDLVLSPELDKFSNLLEDALPPAYAASSMTETEGLVPVSLGSVLYFCVPKNDKLLEYWDTVEDRLFKIRHCMNIEGVVRELPLFQPPIEPGLLVRAVAAGIDISSVLNDMNAPVPHYRCQVMLQKALELCNEVKALGAALLSALEKRDAETIALLRSTYEINLLEAVRQVKVDQVREADTALEVLEKSNELTTLRRDHYASKDLMNASESAYLSSLSSGIVYQTIQGETDTFANLMFAIPDTEAGAPTTAGATFGGSNLGNIARAFSSFMGILASINHTEGVMSNTLGSHQQRYEEWQLQKDLADKELEQLEKQTAAAEIRKAIADKDLVNHELQIENTKTVDSYMHDKFTNQELYNWMVGKISVVYYQSYQLAYDIAKRAEKAYRYELGLDDSNFIQFGYWDSLKKGLLAGERLYHDLKRLEIAYLDQNKREYELTKHISLAQLEPIALLQLRETGECFVSIPEVLFDLDYPGHYFRRIKSISLTIPCVAGPYTTVSCTLTLQSDRIRKKTSTNPQYAWSGDFEDNRFNFNLAGIQSIATSSGQNDSGLFELNFRDERYLPFEGAGAISTWHIQLPKDFRQFDYDTISDVVMHMRYTAREGGDQLKKEATNEIETALEYASAEVPLIRAFSAKQEFSSEWHQFLHPKDTDESHKLDLGITPNRFPFQFRGKAITISKVDVFLKFKDIKDPTTYTASTTPLGEEAVGTPLGDYASDDALELRLMLPAPDASTPLEPIALNSDPLFQGTPHAVFADGISHEVKASDSWILEAGDDEIGIIASTLWTCVGEHNRLKAEAIEDLIVICHYSVSDIP